jgi:hypothetical protein
MVDGSLDSSSSSAGESGFDEHPASPTISKPASKELVRRVQRDKSRVMIDQQAY